MAKQNPELQYLLLLLLIFPILNPILALDFVFNGFNHSSNDQILLYGNATIDSHVLTLTRDTTFSRSRALYPSKIPTKKSNSSYVCPFSTSFIFSMAPHKHVMPGHGFVFVFVPFPDMKGTTSAEYLGFLNFTNNGNSANHVLGVEFDVRENIEFKDINGNHVGIDVNSLTSVYAHDAGYWVVPNKSFKELKMNTGENYQVWIDYKDMLLNVTMARAGMKRPVWPLLSVFLNLSEVFLDEMYVGFTSSTGTLYESHRILAWSFSNENFSLSENLVTANLPSFAPPKKLIFQSKGFIAGIIVGSFLILCCCVLISIVLKKKKLERVKKREEMEEWEFEYWPHKITYQEIEAATKGFDEENVIGIGGNGKVYKGVLSGGTQIAVKCISHENDGMREFLSEISTIGRLKHRNLVGLKGWCKKERGTFLLAYDYMENGSLDKWVFDENLFLNCEERIRILKDVAFGVLYLHEGWESKVLHRDIKASNVLLDREMKGRLGDFGLARVHKHDDVARTTKVVGTIGYLAPEVLRFGRASYETDVFGFGVMILEVMCGRRPIEEGKPNLIDWLWNLMMQEKLLDGLDERLRRKGGFDKDKVERVLQLGLLCAYPNPKARLTMRQVVEVLEGKVGNDMSESVHMDTHLLGRKKCKELWMEYSQGLQYGSHPTFDDFQQYNWSSTSLSWSNKSDGPRGP